MIIFIPKACNFISLDSRVNNEGEGGGGGGRKGVGERGGTRAGRVGTEEGKEHLL